MLTGCFLSCLLGSELLGGLHCRERGFLSCLLGSERIDQSGLIVATFLSCLLGSEHEKKTK